MYFKRIKDLRIDNDLYQKQVAKILKITRQQYSLYETGKRDIPVGLLCKLADYYNTSTDYILNRTNVKNTLKKEEKHIEKSVHKRTDFIFLHYDIHVEHLRYHQAF